jgi:hypothetical protein
VSDTHIQHLTSFWLGTQQYNLATLETYYYAQQTARAGMLTATQAATADITRFWRPVNYAATIIDEPVGYLANGRVRITSDNDAITAWANDYHNRRVRPRMDDLIRWQGLYGEAYLYLWTDYEGATQGLKVDAIPPIENGKRRVMADYGGQDPEELTRAVIYKLAPVDTAGAMDEYRITISADSIKVERRRISSALAGGYSQFTLVSEDANPANVLPIVPVFNPIPSDILDFTNIQDDLDKLHLDMRLSREYHGVPLITTTADALPDDMTVGAGRIFFGGDFKRLDPPTNEGMLRELERLLQSGAMICRSLALANQSGVTLSGLALRYLQQNFESRLQAKAQRLETGLENALTTAARLIASDARLMAAEVRDLPDVPRPTAAQLASATFQVVLEPNIPADEKANAEVAAIWLNQLGVSQETALGKAGVENPAGEVEKARAERDANMAAMPVIAGANDEPDEDEDDA